MFCERSYQTQEHLQHTPFPLKNEITSGEDFFSVGLGVSMNLHWDIVIKNVFSWNGHEPNYFLEEKDQINFYSF